VAIVSRTLRETTNNLDVCGDGGIYSIVGTERVRSWLQSRGEQLSIKDTLAQAFAR
jgi:hypothetical protein